MKKTTSAHAETIAAIRGFSRFYTRRIGVLRAGLFDRRLSLTEARVLYELAQGDGTTARQLERGLELDPGYVSRILAQFARRRWLKRERSTTDGRQMLLRLTAAGREAFAEIDARSAEQMGELVGHLPPASGERLAGLLHAARHLLTAPEERTGTVTLREPKPGELGWVVERHGAIYAREFGWDGRFEALVARIVADYAEAGASAKERCWIADLDGQPVGCVFLVKKTATVAKLRLLLVEPGARGRGVGDQLVAACVEFARAAGYRTIELWTNSVLVAARRIYERAGFKCVKSTRHQSFGQELVGEFWERSLT